MVNQNKKTQVDSLASVLEKNSNFILLKIDGTTHKNLEKLRRELRKVAASVKVIKNSYFEKAVNKLTLKNKIYADLKKKFLPLTASSAIVFLNDKWDEGLKALHEFSKEEKTLLFKLSILDKSIYDDSSTARIAQLPGRGQLVANIIGSLRAPTSKFVHSLKFNTNKLVYILQAKSKEVKN